MRSEGSDRKPRMWEVGVAERAAAALEAAVVRREAVGQQAASSVVAARAVPDTRAVPRARAGAGLLLATALLACLPVALLAQSRSDAPSPARRAQATREFLGLGPPPDPEAARRGAPIYAANCAFCHGPQARGAEGPSLIYSEMVLKDQHGTQLAEFLKNGRPEKGMPAFSTLTEEQRKDIAEFVHQQIEDVANRGTYEVKNILLGDARKGAKYVASHCLQCHSVTGDLKGLSAKWRPVELQRYWIMPPRTSPSRAIRAKVSSARGTWEGRVQQIDDFRVVLALDSGKSVVIARDPGVVVELHDPLAPHVALVGNLADSDMINVTAYLESLK